MTTNEKRELRIPNVINIKRVVWKSREYEVFCPLGNDYCTRRFEVELVCGRYYFDFFAIDDFLTENVKGGTQTMEESAHLLYQYLINELEPISLKVRAITGTGIYVVEI